MSIILIGENFLRPWKPEDINTFLAGCQECLVLLAEALQRQGYKVKVLLHGPTKIDTQICNGIEYSDFSKFIVDDSVIILFKINPLPEDKRLETANVIFWSSDVQTNVSPDRYIKKYVCLTDYHLNRNGWKNGYVIPHGIDFLSLRRNRTEKENDTMLYCSSPDRGLAQVLQQWEVIKTYYPNLKLYITYGFKIAKQILDKSTLQSEEELKQFCTGKDITYLADLNRTDLEKLMWRCKYWVLPLNNPDSELFCLSAVKAQFCGCIPVVNKLGALTETVGDYIEFSSFCRGDTTIVRGKTNSIYSWDDVVMKYWIPLLA